MRIAGIRPATDTGTADDADADADTGHWTTATVAGQVAISAGFSWVPYFDTALATAIIAAVVVAVALIYEFLMSGNFTRIVNNTLDCRLQCNVIK